MRVCGALFLFGLFPILGRGHLRSCHRILFENLLLYSLYLSDAEIIGCQDHANGTELRRPRRERRFQNHLRSTHFLPVSSLPSCILPGGFFVFLTTLT